ncbi:MAG: hypothetical protein JWR50_757 [Mucilaginibacter sp.]|nr:hypothetical protein [Mucilaginibacter sp.]
MKITRTNTFVAMSKTTDTYPNFEYKAGELNKYIATAQMITIMLKNGEIIHYFPENTPSFLQWLCDHHIKDIK